MNTDERRSVFIGGFIYTFGCRVNYIEVRLKTALDCGEVLASLNDPDVLGAWENGGTLHLYWPEDRWDSGMLQRLRTALGALKRPRSEGHHRHRCSRSGLESDMDPIHRAHSRRAAHPHPPELERCTSRSRRHRA